MLAADRHAFKKNLEELNQLLSRHSKKIKEVELIIRVASNNQEQKNN